MPVDVGQLKINVRDAERRVDEASMRAGRSDRPRILVASKYLDVEGMALLQEAGIRLVGENRADELHAKWQKWDGAFEFHFIGHLQSRKVRQVLPYVTMVHSIDSISLVEEIDRRAEAVVRALLEVNVSGEETKFGLEPAAAKAFLERASVYGKVDFVGFMTMAPLVDEPEQARPCFRELRALRDDLAGAFAGRYDLAELSMGMSNDYEVAVEEGATIVRLGSALLSSA